MSVGKYLTGSEYKVDRKIDADSQDATKIISEDQDRTVLFTDLNGGRAVGNLFSALVLLPLVRIGKTSRGS